MTQLQTLENEYWQVGILPETGASVAFGRVKHGSDWVDIMRPTDPADYDNSSNCASFILIPWSNRIRDGKFRFDGQEYQLEINQPSEGLAIHGDVRKRAWKVASASSTELVLTFDSREHQDVNYPFAFSARAEYRLDGADFVMGLALKNEDAHTIPGGFGHHPYFVRYETGASVLLQVPCDKYYDMQAAMPTSAAVPVPDRLDFRVLRPLGDDPLDDLFTGRLSEVSGRMIYPAWNTEITMTSDPIYEHTIVYAPVGEPYYAVEPVTNANDGFNLYDQGVAGTGVFILQPGEEKSGLIRLHVENTSG
ncbi:MAG: aldose 1-epimerase [Anaerolineae bacterium]|nr:aldose 1-epimerase [Anaerolineae bacterium]